MGELHRYGDPAGDPNLGDESARDLEKITSHITEWWGNIESTFHELVSEYVHVDVHWIKPVPDHPYHTLITSGMSDRPMKRAGKPGEFYSELVLALPSDWPVDQESFGDERIYWPLRQLKQAARFPHVYNTVLSYGHTIANDDPPRPYADDVGFCASILSFPFLCDEEGWTLKIDNKKTIQFLSLIPIFEQELNFARREGSEKLFDIFDEEEITELINKLRPSVCAG